MSDARIARAQALHWENFFGYLRREVDAKVDADAIFIDAPTGLSDTANVCLRLLANVVVMMFNPTPIQLDGVGQRRGIGWWRMECDGY